MLNSYFSPIFSHLKFLFSYFFDPGSHLTPWGWGGSCRGGLGHVGWGGSCRVGWVMQGLGGSSRGGVGYVEVGWVM